MPALNFKRQFADLVKAGKKRQTIRQPRQDQQDPDAGSTLYLYSGLRTKQARRLDVVVCRQRQMIKIAEGDQVELDGEELDRRELERFALADGFPDVASFVEFFRSTYGLPFHGYVYYW